MSEQFIDLKFQAECVLLRLTQTRDSDERKTLLHELRLVIEELDLEVGMTLPLVLGADFVTQMDGLAQP